MWAVEKCKHMLCGGSRCLSIREDKSLTAFGVRAPKFGPAEHCIIENWKRKGWGTQFEGNLFIYRLSSTTAVWFPQILLCYPHFPLCARFWILFQYLCTFVFVFCVFTNFPLYLVPITDSVSLFPLFLLFLQIAPFVSISLFLAPLIASAAALLDGFASPYSASWRVRSPTFQLQYHLSDPAERKSRVNCPVCHKDWNCSWFARWHS